MFSNAPTMLSLRANAEEHVLGTPSQRSPHAVAPHLPLQAAECNDPVSHSVNRYLLRQQLRRTSVQPSRTAQLIAFRKK